MSRKHFQALADALKNLKPEADATPEAGAQWVASVRAIADVCASQNGLFDRSRFYAACGLDD